MQLSELWQEVYREAVQLTETRTKRMEESRLRNASDERQGESSVRRLDAAR